MAQEDLSQQQVPLEYLVEAQRTRIAEMDDLIVKQHARTMFLEQVISALQKQLADTVHDHDPDHQHVEEIVERSD